MKSLLKKLNEFLLSLLKTSGDISSNRFLGIFVYTPALIVMIFTGVAIEYVIAVIGLITSLLITNAVSKFANRKKEDITF